MNELLITTDNAMLARRPDLFNEWDFEKNDELGLNIYKVTYGSNTKAWWKCKMHHSWYSNISSRVMGCKCCYCAGRKVLKGYNDMWTVEPEKAKLLANIEDGYINSRSSSKIVSWRCLVCESEYDNSINGHTGCPYCSGNRVNNTNSLASLNPELASEWNPTLNGELTPHDVTSRSGIKVWWLGKCGHEWNNAVDTQFNKKGCPYCSKYNGKLLVGFNDMWTTNPELAKLLHNPEDGYRYMQSSNKKVNWKCPDCDSKVKNRHINNVKRQGLKCPLCSDGISLGEKIAYQILKNLNIEFDYDSTQEWSQNKRYDFYIPSLKMIIETHGGQHYKEQGFKSYGERSLECEQINDELKYRIAIENGIENYVVIDTSVSDFNYILKNITNSDLIKILRVSENDILNFKDIKLPNLVIESCNLWNSGVKSTNEISKLLNVHRGTVKQYLIRGAFLGLCDYTVEKGRYLSDSRKRTDQYIRVAQLTLEFEFIRWFENVKEATSFMEIKNQANIRHCCQGRSRTSMGYIWMYEDDYNKKVVDVVE